MSFPEGLGPVFAVTAIVEGLFGILKSKGTGRGYVFYLSLLLEVVCAISQSVALLFVAFRSGYRQTETAAAVIAVVFDSVLLVIEAVNIFRKLERGKLRRVTRSTIIALVFALILGAASIPALVAKLTLKTLPFKNDSNGTLLLLLSLGPFLAIPLSLLFSLTIQGCTTISESPLRLFYSALWEGELRQGLENFFIIMSVAPPILIGCLVFCGLAVVLGVRALVEADNISLTFLIISNMIPAIVTFVSSLVLQEPESCAEDAKGNEPPMV